MNNNTKQNFIMIDIETQEEYAILIALIIAAFILLT